MGICVIAFYSMRETQRVRPSPNDDVNVMNAQFLSPQGSHVLHTNLPVSQHVTHHVIPVERSGKGCPSFWHVLLWFSVLGPSCVWYLFVGRRRNVSFS